MAGNFRRLLTTKGIVVLAGKNAETNEELVKQAGKNEYVLHTEKPGSPFVNIKSSIDSISKEDIKEAAIFCARYSGAWKKANKKPSKIEVHYFLGKDIFKLDNMKIGTFGVTNYNKIIIKKEEIKNDD